MAVSPSDLDTAPLASPKEYWQFRLTSVMMLRHIGEAGAARRIERAVLRVLEQGRVKTRDVGGWPTTAEFCRELIRRLDSTR